MDDIDPAHPRLILVLGASSADVNGRLGAWTRAPNSGPFSRRRPLDIPPPRTRRTVDRAESAAPDSPLVRFSSAGDLLSLVRARLHRADGNAGLRGLQGRRHGARRRESVLFRLRRARVPGSAAARWRKQNRPVLAPVGSLLARYSGRRCWRRNSSLHPAEPPFPTAPIATSASMKSAVSLSNL